MFIRQDVTEEAKCDTYAKLVNILKIVEQFLRNFNQNKIYNLYWFYD